MSIKLPELFEEKLNNPKLKSAVFGAISFFDELFMISKLPFFPDYTDHGYAHINSVLNTASLLITKKAADIFTEEDCTILILATLYHDSALHMSEFQFKELIKGKARNWKNDEFDKQSWSELWNNFLFSAKRWDDQKLIEVFGEKKPNVPRGVVRDPFHDYTNLADIDLKLIGEFIRLHHPRLAHEFVVYGFPSTDGTPINSKINISSEFADIIGIVARSHGIPIRSCLEYIENEYDKREYQNVHIVYLMTLLRISDYLQIQPDRAPSLAFKYKFIYSKASLQEWRTHNAITNISRTHDDPESIKIDAIPTDVHTYIHLKEWLLGLQSELDMSWTVLGEIYGRYEELKELGIIIRRVRSNIENVDQFSSKVKYIPDKIEFSVKRPDLLKLLIKPLYGEKPEIGIRELMQNAIDAVRELWEFQKNEHNFKNVQLVDQKGDVEIWLDSPDESGWAWLSISDRGIGMTETVIKDYFLKAGASYRQSEKWKKLFEHDKAQSSEIQNEKSRILRSGRFGVGLLAGFLLGEEFEVLTRHITKPYGLRFKTNLELIPIEIKKDESLKIGTIIRTKVSPEIQNKLQKPSSRWWGNDHSSWDWYCFDKPYVRRLIGNSKIELEQEYKLSYDECYKPSKMRKLPEFNFGNVFWTYEKAPFLNVNGIKVKEKNNYKSGFPRRVTNDSEIDFSVPKFSILDPDGVFPINLIRDGMTISHVPFESDVIEEIVKDFLAFCIVNTPDEYSLNSFIKFHNFPYSSHGISLKRTNPFNMYFYTQEGLGIIASLHKNNNIRHSIVIPKSYQFEEEFNDSSFTINHNAILSCNIAFGDDGLEKVLNKIGESYFLNDKTSIKIPIRIFTTNLLLSLKRPEKYDDWSERDDYSKNERLKKYQKRQEIAKLLQCENKSKSMSVYSSKNCPESLVNYNQIQKIFDKLSNKKSYSYTSYDRYSKLEGEGDPFFIEFFGNPINIFSGYSSLNTINRYWQEIIQYPVIPFNNKNRCINLENAYTKLEKYIEIQEAIKEQKLATT